MVLATVSQGLRHFLQIYIVVLLVGCVAMFVKCELDVVDIPYTFAFYFGILLGIPCAILHLMGLM